MGSKTQPIGDNETITPCRSINIYPRPDQRARLETNETAYAETPFDRFIQFTVAFESTGILVRTTVYSKRRQSYGFRTRGFRSDPARFGLRAIGPSEPPGERRKPRGNSRDAFDDRTRERRVGRFVERYEPSRTREYIIRRESYIPIPFRQYYTSNRKHEKPRCSLKYLRWVEGVRARSWEDQFVSPVIGVARSTHTHIYIYLSSSRNFVGAREETSTLRDLAA